MNLPLTDLIIYIHKVSFKMDKDWWLNKNHALTAIALKALSLGKSRLWSQLGKGDLNPLSTSTAGMQELGHWIKSAMARLG